MKIIQNWINQNDLTFFNIQKTWFVQLFSFKKIEI